MAKDAPNRDAPIEALLERYRRYGDAEALGALFDRTAPVLFRIALAMLPDAASAEDAVQETYLAVLDEIRDPGGYDASRPLMPWLVGILQTMVKRSRRGAARVPDPLRVHAAGASDDAPPPDSPMERGEDATRVRAAIDALDEPYRGVALLRWRYGLEPAEIADVRNEAPGTTRSLLSRALSKMRGALRSVPAAFIDLQAPRGLDAVRAVVLKVAVPAAAAAGGAVAASLLTAKTVAVAATILVVVTGTWIVIGSSGASGGSSDAAPSDEAAPISGGGGATAPPSPIRAPALNGSPRSSGRGQSAPPRGPFGAGESAGGSASDGKAAPASPDAPVPPIVAVSDAQGNPDVVPGTPGINEPVAKAIERGVAWLKSKQSSDGSWRSAAGAAGCYPWVPEGDYKHPAGPTALALYTLLKCRVDANDATVRRGFSFLRNKSRIPEGPYEASVLLLALAATADPTAKSDASAAGRNRAKWTGELRNWAQELQDLLLKNREGSGWRYGVPAQMTAKDAVDLPSTNLTLLALFAADACGLKTESTIWDEAIDLAMAQQEDDGERSPTHRSAGKPLGFVYVKDTGAAPDANRPTGGMTACGIATLAVSRAVLLRRHDSALRRQGRAVAIEQAIADGLLWLDAHWDARDDRGRADAPGYGYALAYALSLETALELVRREKVGRHDAFAGLAPVVLTQQLPKGCWDAQLNPEPQGILDTCFSLLFLSRPWKDAVPEPEKEK